MRASDPRVVQNPYERYVDGHILADETLLQRILHRRRTGQGAVTFGKGDTEHSGDKPSGGSEAVRDRHQTPLALWSGAMTCKGRLC